MTNKELICWLEDEKINYGIKEDLEFGHRVLEVQLSLEELKKFIEAFNPELKDASGCCNLTIVLKE